MLPVGVRINADEVLVPSNAAIAPSRAVLRNVITVERSTPASAAAVVNCPVSIRCHRSYFCSAVRNRFARPGVPSGRSPVLLSVLRVLVPE